MPLPAGLATVTVSGKVTRPGQGTNPDPLVGRITFTPTAPQIVATASGSLIMGTVTAEPDGAGDYSAVLLAPDDTGINPQGWTYKVEIDFLGVPDPDVFYISLTKDTPTVQLITLLPVGPTTGNSVGSATVVGDLHVTGNFTVGSVAPGVIDPIPHAARHAAGGVDPVTEVQVANVLNFGAKADGGGVNPTDNTPYFQAAHDSLSQGGVLYIPPGHYRLASTVHISKGVTVRGGGWSPHFVPRTNMTASYVRPATGGLFVGTALFSIDPAPVNGAYIDSAYGGGPRIQGLALNGKNAVNSVAGAIAGISIASGTKDVGIKDVAIWQFTGDAIVADNGAGMIFERVTASTNGGNGINLMTTTTGGAVDVDLIEVYSQGNSGDGFILQNPNAASLIGCRSEWNAGYGYNVNGICYSLVMSACNTDRSGKHGFHMTAVDGGRLPLIIGCQAKRDGSSAGTWAGFNFQGVDGTTQSPGGILQGCEVYVGRNDDNTGTRSPQYGLQASFTRRVQLSGGWFEGTTAAYNDSSFSVAKPPGVVQAVIDPSTGVSTISNSDRMDINGNPGATRALRYFSRGLGQRWEVRTESTSESGSNAGSNFQFARFNDAGTEIDVPFSINRATGEVNASKSLSSSGPSLGMPTPVAANGYAAWTGDPELAGTSSSAAPGGTLLLRKMFIARSATITQAFINLSAAATTPTAASNWVGLYDSAGNRLAQVDVTSQITATGHLAATFSSSVAVTPGTYYLALLFNGATNPAPFRSSSSLIASMNGLVSASAYRACTNGSGLTTLPATFTPSSNSQSNAQAYWAALV